MANIRIKNGWMCYDKWYPYEEFEFEGSRPFAHIKFKNYDKPAGCLANIMDLHVDIEKVRRRAESERAKL